MDVQIETCVHCNQPAEFKTKSGKPICMPSSNSCPSVKAKCSAGLSVAHAEGRMNSNFAGKHAWAKGLTKDTHASIAKTAQKNSLKQLGRVGKAHTPEMRKHLSLKRTQYLQNAKHIQWLELPNGLKVQGRWEFHVGLKLLKLGHILKRIPVFYDSNRRYTPDFFVDDSFYVEVKGWLSDRDIDKYQRVFIDNPDIRIILIRNECGFKNYDKFVSGEISVLDCECLRDAVMNKIVHVANPKRLSSKKKKKKEF